MLLEDEKLKGLEQLLAETVPAAVAVLQQLLSSASDEVRLGAARSLLDTWACVKDDDGTQPKVIKHYKAMVLLDRAVEKSEVSEEMVEQMLTNVMSDDQGPELTDGDDLMETSAAPVKSAKTMLAGAPSRQAVSAKSAAVDAAPAAKPSAAAAAPAKSAPTPPASPSRNGTQEKPAPTPKTKPKRGDDDERPRVPIKYWIILGVGVLLLGVSWLTTSGPPTVGGLAQRALTAEKSADRQVAVAELCALQSQEVVPQLRRLLKESKDPTVLVDVMVNLGIRCDFESVPQVISQLDDAAPNVQLAAFTTLTKILGTRAFQGLELREDNTPEKREEVKRIANEKLEARKRMGAKL